jgi:hypothetical protein
LETKQMWLSKLDAPTWGKASAVVSEVAIDAAKFAMLDEDCTSGYHQACEELSLEDSAKVQWLAKFDVPSWHSAAKVVSTVSHAASSIARLDGECNRGDYTACDVLSREEEAKTEWLAKFDAQTWKEAATVVNEVAGDAAQMAALDADRDMGYYEWGEMLSREAEAKFWWLAMLDVPSWGKVASTISETTDNVLAEEVASKRSEEDAKKRWLAKFDAPTWGKAKAVVNEAADEAERLATLETHCTSGYDAACEELSREDEAKKVWLSKFDVKGWDSAARVVSTVSDAASSMAVLDAECKQGDYSACDALSEEEDAKKAWVAELPWEMVASTVSNVLAAAKANEAAAWRVLEAAKPFGGALEAEAYEAWEGAKQLMLRFEHEDKY